MVWYDISPYVLCWVFSCSCAYIASKSKSNIMKFIFSILSILVPSILAGIRADTVGVDIRGYGIAHYNSARIARSFYDFITVHGNLRFESGWFTLTYISTKIFNSLNWNLFFYNLLNCTCFYIGAWKHRKFAPLPLIMLIFFLMQYNSTYNLMRQSAACSIIFMGFDTLEKKQYLKFCLYIIAATSFHTSAIFVVIYMLGFHIAITSNTGRLKNVINLFLYSLVLLCFLARPIFAILANYITFFQIYTGHNENIFANNYTVGTMLVGELMMFLFYPNGGMKIFRKSPGGEKMFNYYRYSIVFGIAFYFGAHIFARGYFYFEYVNILAYSVLHKFIMNKYLRFIVFMISLLAYFGYFYQYFMVRNMANCGSFPYVTIFSQSL